MSVESSINTKTKPKDPKLRIIDVSGSVDESVSIEMEMTNVVGKTVRANFVVDEIIPSSYWQDVSFHIRDRKIIPEMDLKEQTMCFVMDVVQEILASEIQKSSRHSGQLELELSVAA